MSPDELLSSLAATMGLSGARFDDNRACRLKFDGRLEIDLEAPEESAVLNLFGLIGTLPAQTPAGFCELLLEANLPSNSGAGPVIALDGATRELLLTQTLSVERLTVDALAQTLERLLAELEDWQDRLAASSHSQETFSEDPAETPVVTMMAV